MTRRIFTLMHFIVLAALMTASGANILNGNRQLMALGEYDGAGTRFDYRRRSGHECPGACIFAPGPLNMPVDVKVSKGH
jgi:hypothetical protein